MSERERERERERESLQQLRKQGPMSRCSSPEGAKVWAKGLEGVKDEHLKFALNNAVDMLPHNANLYLWKKHKDSSCPLCGERQTLIHVLNACGGAARNARRFNTCHDAVLEEIISLLSAYTEPPAKLSADLDNYNFPHHIVPTDLCPDIVWWDDQLRRIVIAELTISFETSFKQAAERKALKYEDVITRARSVGYSGTVITLQLGSRGIIDQASFTLLQSEFNIHKHEESHLLARITSLVLKESYKIWCQRNCQPLS